MNGSTFIVADLSFSQQKHRHKRHEVSNLGLLLFNR